MRPVHIGALWSVAVVRMKTVVWGGVGTKGFGLGYRGCTLSLLIDTYVLMHKLVRLGRQALGAAP